MRTLKIIGRIVGCIITVALAFLLCCSVYSLIARQFLGQEHPSVFGWSCAVVVTGSMEPEISVNDLIVIHGQDDYQVRDVITFFDNGGTVVTHRIIEETDEGYRTKGDANNVADTLPIPQKDVIGKVVFTLPKVGRFIEIMGTPFGMAVTALVGFLLIEIPYLLQRTVNKIQRRRQG